MTTVANWPQQVYVQTMCGRFANQLDWIEEWVALLGEWPADAPQRFNIAPTQTVAAFTPDDGYGMRWGLVPSWSKEPKTKYSTFNAVLETIEAKSLYRGPWKDGKRCIVPVLGYYEWKTEEGVKQPYLIRSADGNPLFLGGLWETWRGDDETLLSCTVLTRKPLASIEHIHNRMPVVIPMDQLTSWFEAAPDDAKKIASKSEPDLEHYAVSRYVNNARNDGAECVERSDREA